MITYLKSNLKIAEFHFDEETRTENVDIARFQYRPEQVSGTHSYPVATIEIDLTPEPEQLLAAMRTMTRRHVRKALTLDLRYEFNEQPDDRWVDEFITFFGLFAQAKGISEANQERLRGMRDHGALDLSRVKDAAGETLVWHCHLRSNGRARLIHSASFYRDAEKDRADLISKGNYLCHWNDLLRLRENGTKIYDFGGWYEGDTDKPKLSINEFKKGWGGEVVRRFNTDQGVTFKGTMAIKVRRGLDALRGRA